MVATSTASATADTALRAALLRLIFAYEMSGYQKTEQKNPFNFFILPKLMRKLGPNYLYCHFKVL